LVVFVHGFGGHAMRTWGNFPESGMSDAWWRACDMLFVGYQSWKDNPGEIAARLCDRLPTYFPRLPRQYVEAGEAAIRSHSEEPYRELLLVGHSLGGVILRIALHETAEHWVARKDEQGLARSRPILLDSQIRLFSPAIEGFRPAGWLGVAKAIPCLWNRANVALAYSATYQNLQEGSALLRTTKERTLQLIGEYGDELGALHAHILWEKPEKLVVQVHYKGDTPRWPTCSKSHTEVCKPNRKYSEPRRFVETGSPS
jgi:pimeloyl-ACP methyl ester carboxylesterase